MEATEVDDNNLKHNHISSNAYTNELPSSASSMIIQVNQQQICVKNTSLCMSGCLPPRLLKPFM